MTRQQKRQATLALRQERTEKLRSLGLRLKDAKNQSRGEASKVTKLYSKLREFLGGSGEKRFEFVPNRKLSRSKKLLKEAKQAQKGASLSTGIFVAKGLGQKKRILPGGKISSLTSRGRFIKEQSIVIPFDLEKWALGGVSSVLEEVRALGWESWTIRPMFDGRPSASAYDKTTFEKEGERYVEGNTKVKGRGLTGFLVTRVLTDKIAVKGALEGVQSAKKTAKRTGKSKAKNGKKAKRKKDTEKEPF